MTDTPTAVGQNYTVGVKINYRSNRSTLLFSNAKWLIEEGITFVMERQPFRRNRLRKCRTKQWPGPCALSVMGSDPARPSQPGPDRDPTRPVLRWKISLPSAAQPGPFIFDPGPLPGRYINHNLHNWPGRSGTARPLCTIRYAVPSPARLCQADPARPEPSRSAV
jgi:hypothetical protein